jgi:hypothetical protein
MECLGPFCAVARSLLLVEFQMVLRTAHVKDPVLETTQTATATAAATATTSKGRTLQETTEQRCCYQQGQRSFGGLVGETSWDGEANADPKVLI